MPIKKAKIFTVTSVRGGTGKTTTVLNLAGVFSRLKNKILIIDLDLYGGGIAISLGVSNDNDIYKLVDDLENNRFNNIENYISRYNDNIDVLPSPKDPRFSSKVNSKYINVIFSIVASKYDVILIDTNYFMSDINLTTMDNSDEIIYVMGNDLIDLKNMKTMIGIYNDMNKNNYKIILNDSTNNQKNYFSKYDIKNIIKNKVNYTIPNSFYIRSIDKYVLEGKILTLDNFIIKKHINTIKIYENIANDLLNV